MPDVIQESEGYDRDDPEVRLGRALEHLQITLSVEMQRLRDKRGLTQAQIGERLGVDQSAVSKLENANVKSDIESVLRYFHALDADLVLGVLDDSEFVPVSEAAENWCEDLEG